MVSTIPLFQMPVRAIKTTLKHCDITELILLSTLSKRAKSFVRSDKQNAYSIGVDISTGCIVYLPSWTEITFGEPQQGEFDIQPLTTCTVRVQKTRVPAEISFALPGFSVRDWLIHFMYIFNCPIINLSFGPRDDWRYSLESVRKVVEGFSIGTLEVSDNACEIIKLLPNMNSLCLDQTDLEQQFSEADLNFIKKVLLGNMARLRIYQSIPIDLNTLLMMNCPDIGICCNLITDKELNMFLKLWLKGAGPNLRQMNIDPLRMRNDLHLNQNVILRGITYQGPNEDIAFVSKYTIWKKDGTQATLLMTPVSFTFLVHP